MRTIVSVTLTEPPRATTREWIGTGVLTLPALLASMDLSVLFMASPWISADLAPTASQHLWVMDVYWFVMAGLLITMRSVGDRIGRRKLLLLGATLSLTAILPLVHGIMKIAEEGPVWTTLAAIVLGAVLAALFVVRQRTAASPMIDVRLVARPAFSGSIIANAIVVFATAGMGLLSVTFLQTVLGFAPLAAALWMLPAVAGSFLGVVIAALLARTVRPALLASIGLLVAAGGVAGMSLVTPDSHVGLLIIDCSALTLGVGMTATMVTSLVLTTAPPEKAGAASALAETSSEFGGALGIATLGTLAGTIYRGAMTADPVPGAENAADAAGDTVGAAVAAARGLPAEGADLLLRQAFEAYTHGLSLAAVVGAAVLALAAVGAGLALRTATTPQFTNTEE